MSYVATDLVKDIEDAQRKLVTISALITVMQRSDYHGDVYAGPIDKDDLYCALEALNNAVSNVAEDLDRTAIKANNDLGLPEGNRG